MTARINQSPNVNWAYYIVALIVCAFFYHTFSESLCSLSHWFSETCNARISATKA